MSRPVVILASYLVRYPLGGNALAQLHYAVGLLQLGFDPVFVEHYGWPNSCYDPVTNTMSDDPSHGLAELERLLRPHGIRWCYVDASGRYHGMTRDQLQAACRESEFLLSVAATTWVDEFTACRRRAFIDTDPCFTQARMPAQPEPSRSGFASPYDFQVHFSLGERIGKPGCPIPTHGLHWRPTRWPVVLDSTMVRYEPHAPRYTTVMSWDAYGTVAIGGQSYGQKDVELARLMDLPSRTGPVLELALAGKDAPMEKLRAAGWVLTDPLRATATVERYIEYIGQSRGEFSVAKNGYVKSRSGWFSERTAKYLAMGKPCIVQDTGFSDWIDCGEGLCAFDHADDIVMALDAIESNYRHHCAAARAVAERYFDSRKILGELVHQIQSAPL
jgi:hypothetical protein